LIKARVARWLKARCTELQLYTIIELNIHRKRPFDIKWYYIPEGFLQHFLNLQDKMPEKAQLWLVVLWNQRFPMQVKCM